MLLTHITNSILSNDWLKMRKKRFRGYQNDPFSWNRLGNCSMSRLKCCHQKCVFASAAFYFSADTRNIESQCIFFNLIELLVLLLLLIWDQYVCHRYVYFLYLFIEIPQWTIPIAGCFANTWNKGIFSLEMWYSVLSNDHVSIEWKSGKKTAC